MEPTSALPLVSPHAPYPAVTHPVQEMAYLSRTHNSSTCRRARHQKGGTTLPSARLESATRRRKDFLLKESAEIREKITPAALVSKNSVGRYQSDQTGADSDDEDLVVTPILLSAITSPHAHHRPSDGQLQRNAVPKAIMFQDQEDAPPSCDPNENEIPCEELGSESLDDEAYEPESSSDERLNMPSDGSEYEYPPSNKPRNRPSLSPMTRRSSRKRVITASDFEIPPRQLRSSFVDRKATSTRPYTTRQHSPPLDDLDHE